MTLKKDNKTINFAKGMDTKTDPWQMSFDNFLYLKNSVFTTGNRLTKRAGNPKLSALPNTDATYLTTFNGNLTAIGTSIQAQNQSNRQWVSKGSIQPMEVGTLPLITNNLNQIQSDAAVASNGLVCTVFTETDGTTTYYRYAVADSITGQNITAPTNIPVTSGAVTGSARVFVLGNFFIIVFTNVITATSHLQYVAVSLLDPANVSSNVDIAASYVSSARLSWDGYVVGTKLFLAYNTTAGGQSVKVTYLTASNAAQGLGPSAAVTFAGLKATLLSVCADTSVSSSPKVWVNTYRSDTSVGSALAVDQNLNTLLAPTSTLSAVTVLNLATAAQSGVCSLFYEIENYYSFDSSIPTHYVNKKTITQAGTVSSASTVARSIGLASKAFIVDEVIYFLSAYDSQYQPTYFLVNGSVSTQNAPVVSGKLAYGNGGGYTELCLPSVSVLNSNTAYLSYLFKDTIAAVNKNTDVPTGTQTAGVYAQLGIKLARFTIGTEVIDTAEIGQDLLISGGFLWMYDGYLPVEQNFFLYPDDVTVSAQANPAPTGHVSATTIMTGLSSTAGIAEGMTISGTNITAGTEVELISGTSIVMTIAATGTGNATYTFSGAMEEQDYFYQWIYEWSDNQGNIYRSAPSIPTPVTVGSGKTSVVCNIPTLRLTYKVANPVKITGYRWSTAQPVYYQTTSIFQPELNDTTIDSIQYIDIHSDAEILGNNIIYTNGGVLENTNGPASSVFTLFDNRFWQLDAENKNLWWYSKEVRSGVPVDMSEFLTYYVAPTIGSEGPTGEITAGAPMDDKIIHFKKSAAYYTNGTGPNDLGANNQYSQPIFITSSVGCSNQRSIVIQPAGLMFQSTGKGIWLLERGLGTKYIGAEVEAFNASVVQSAVNIPNSNEIRFTLDTGETLLYDYYFGQWGVFEGTPAISSTIYQASQTYLNSEGVVFQEKAGTYKDGSRPVGVSFTTAWLNLAGINGYQRAYFFYLLGQYYSPHKLKVSVAYDYNPNPWQTNIIYPTNYSPRLGGTLAQSQAGLNPQSPLGQQTPLGGEPRLEEWRVFFKKGRCSAIQITVEEMFDPAFETDPGQGLTLSGIDLYFGVKSNKKPMSNRHSAGRS
jgi:hypothetical protein